MIKLLINLVDCLYMIKNNLASCFQKPHIIELDSTPPRNDFSRYIQNANFSDKSVLIVEANPYHLELLDSVVFYFKSLRFCVDLLVCGDFHSNNARELFTLPKEQILASIDSPNIDKYDIVFFNTMIVDSTYITHIIHPKAKFGILGFIHTLSHIDKIPDIYKQNRLFALRPNINKRIPISFLSPSIERQSYPPSKIITFISIGFLIYHKAFRLTLENITKQLKKDKIDNVRFVLVGRNKLDINNDMINMIVNPSDLDDILATYRAHFVFGLYDRFAHRHYLHDSTSGLRQFSLERNIPMVVNEPFASSFGFDKTNAIVFNNAYKGIKEAISIANTKHYDKIKANLKALNDTLIADSLRNLAHTIELITKETH